MTVADTTDPAVHAWTEAMQDRTTGDADMHAQTSTIYPTPSPLGRLTLATVAVVTVLVTTLAALVVMMPSADAGEGQSRTHVPCAQEDSPGPCVWDAKHSGNGVGSSFVRRPAGHYKYVSHKRAHALLFDADGAK